MITKRLLFILLYALSVAQLQAQDGEAIQIRAIRPGMSEGRLTISASFQDLFSPRIVGTIQSGLPSLVQIEIRLVDFQNRVVTNKRISRQILHNVWEERYTITGSDSSQNFADFAQARAFSERLQAAPLVELADLRPGENYKIQIRVGIVPISTRQSQKVSEWLLNPNETEEGLASEERTTGFRLSLGNLVSFFVGDDKKPRFSSEWFSSDPFRASGLEQ